MSIQPTEAANPNLFAASTSASAAAAQDKDMFLNLMVAQMRYQDPLNPTDSTAFLAQTAQFTSLEKMQEVADQSAMLLASQNAFGASGLVGRHVSWVNDMGAVIHGKVAGVTFELTGPVLDIDGVTVPLGDVLSVNAAAPAAPTTPAPAPAEDDTATP